MDFVTLCCTHGRRVVTSSAADAAADGFEQIWHDMQSQEAQCASACFAVHHCAHLVIFAGLDGHGRGGNGSNATTKSAGGEQKGHTAHWHCWQ